MPLGLPYDVLLFLSKGEMMTQTRLESQFQTQLKKDLEIMFPGIIVLKNNPNKLGGVPDLMLLWNDRWAVLECKRSITETYRPNQEYYIEQWNNMSYASMICPENRKEVLDALSTALRTAR